VGLRVKLYSISSAKSNKVKAKGMSKSYKIHKLRHGNVFESAMKQSFDKCQIVGFRQQITFSKPCWWINCVCLCSTVNVTFCRMVFLHSYMYLDIDRLYINFTTIYMYIICCSSLVLVSHIFAFSLILFYQ